MITIQTIGDRILLVIQESGLKKGEFAAKLGLSQASVSLWIYGRSNPSSQTIKQICDVFGVNRDWLVDGIGEPYVLSPVDNVIAEYLGHAITHSSTAKDRFLKAIAAADEATVAAVLQFILDCADEIRSQE